MSTNSLTDLTFDDCDNVPNLSCISGSRRLISLNILNSEISKCDALYLPNLVELNVSGSDFTELGILSGLDSLRILNCSRCNFFIFL